MLSIGEFSKICEVSTKTLRYYDEIGLLHPDGIHPENGYRYYSIGQLRRMLLIQRLKSYAFALEEIKALLDMDADGSEERLYAALHRKKREIEAKRDEYTITLQRMDRDISNIEKGAALLSHLDQIPIELVETPSMQILYIRRMMKREDYTVGYGAYFAKLFERAAKEQLTLLGTPMTIYHSSEYDPAGNDTEFALPIQEHVMESRLFPEGRCAKAIWRGPYSELTSVYAKVNEWIEERGYAWAGSPYEVYVTDPNQVVAPEDMVTEVYFPVRISGRGEG